MNFSNRTELARAVLKNLLIRGMKLPDSWEAPKEFFSIDGHCGLLAAWAVPHHFGKQPGPKTTVYGQAPSAILGADSATVTLAFGRTLLGKLARALCAVPLLIPVALLI